MITSLAQFLRELTVDDAKDPFIRIASSGAGIYIPVVQALNIVNYGYDAVRYFDERYPHVKHDLYEGIMDSWRYNTGVRDRDRYYDPQKWLEGETGEVQPGYAFADPEYMDLPW